MAFASEERLLRTCNARIADALLQIQKTMETVRVPISEHLTANTFYSRQRRQAELTTELAKVAAGLTRDLHSTMELVAKFQEDIRQHGEQIALKFEGFNQLKKEVDEFEKVRNVNIIPSCIRNSDDSTSSPAPLTLSPSPRRMKELEEEFEREKQVHLKWQQEQKRQFEQELQEAEREYEIEIAKMAEAKRRKDEQFEQELKEAEKECEIEIAKIAEAERRKKEKEAERLAQAEKEYEEVVRTMLPEKGKE